MDKIDKIRLFLKRLKRFFGFFFKGMIKSFLKQEWFKIICEPLIIIFVISVVFGLLSLIILCATILTHSWLHFSDDFTWNSFMGSFVTTALVTSVGGCVALLGYIAIDKLVYLVRRAWDESSTRALATKLWE